MTQELAPRRRKGHPPIDDREHVLGYITAQLALGLNVLQAAKGGLKICGYRPGREGKLELVVLRYLNARTLERRYRELSGSEKVAFGRMTQPFRRAGMRPIGISPAKPSASFISDKQMVRGRPRKKSRT